MTKLGTRVERRPRSRLWDPAVVGTVLALAVSLLPVGLCRGGGRISSPAPPVPPAETPAEKPAPVAGGRDSAQTVRLLREDGTVAQLTMADYLWGVAAAEMPASFEPEALKAQVCAARTYTARLMARPRESHPQAHVCGDSGCCQAYVDPALAKARWGLQAEEYTEKLRRAVAETDGLGVLSGGEPIQALFFSSSPGRTVDAVEVWGREVPYLRGVDSPEGEEVPNWRTQVVLTEQEVRDKILAAHPQADLSGAPAEWFGRRRENSAGGVASMEVGGAELTGKELRGLFGLRSSSFTVDHAQGNFTFTVTGYGHGVGLSQYGANALAREGKDFREILAWYYTDTEIGPLWP